MIGRILGRVERERVGRRVLVDERGADGPVAIERDADGPVAVERFLVGSRASPLEHARALSSPPA